MQKERLSRPLEARILPAMEGRFRPSSMNAESEVIMSITYSGYKSVPQRVTLAPGAAIAVKVRPGTRLRTLEGTVWVTQDGDAKDYIVPVGTRYSADRDGRVVMTAMDGAARVAVSWRTPSPGSVGQKVALDYTSINELRRAAQAARSREIARWFACGWQWLVGAWRGLLAGAATRPHAAGVKSHRACHS
jgi:hypothetical protein